MPTQTLPRSVLDLYDEFTLQLCKLKCLRHASELLIDASERELLSDVNDISSGLSLLFDEVIGFFDQFQESLLSHIGSS